MAVGQKTLARWLKAIIVGAGACGLIVYAAVLPAYGAMLAVHNPDYQDAYWPWLIFLWLTGVPCYWALACCWRIASGIGAGRSFTRRNAALLKTVSILAAADTAFFFLGNIALLLVGHSHPGVVLFSLFVVFAGVAISVASAALSHLVLNASTLQEQSDLTI